PFNADDDRLFSHARVRRLSAEQLQDAIGLVTRAVPGVRELTEDIARRKRDLDAGVASLAAGQQAWEAELKSRVEALPLRGGAWSVSGPYSAGTVDQAHTTAFAPEPGAAAAVPPVWTPRPDVRDGRPVPVSASKSAFYYRRSLHAAASGT